MFDTIYCLFVSLFALWIGFQACITVMQTNPHHTGHNKVIQKKVLQENRQRDRHKQYLVI